jgi:acetoacetyl-CoA synthetase
MLISRTTETLTAIWERVLQRSPIGTEESFFDLGGNEQLAGLLFAEIAEVYGCRLPTATIDHARTISALSAILKVSAPPAFSPLVELKAGSEALPVFIVPGLGGTVVPFFEVANHIETKHPIYGIQARGIDGSSEPFTCVEDMATLYLDALTELQPSGPYLLIGYSFGGLVALEMAQRLSANGNDIALLAMLDTYPHPRFLSRRQRRLLITQRIRFHIEAMRRLPLPSALTYFLGKLKGRLDVTGPPNGGEYGPDTRKLSFVESSLRVKQKAYLALAGYRPRFYRGQITFVTAETKSYFLPQDPAEVWANLAEGFQLTVAPGNHIEMVTTRFEALGSVLRGCIARSLMSSRCTTSSKIESVSG